MSREVIRTVIVRHTCDCCGRSVSHAKEEDAYRFPPHELPSGWSYAPTLTFDGPSVVACSEACLHVLTTRYVEAQYQREVPA